MHASARTWTISCRVQNFYRASLACLKCINSGTAKSSKEVGTIRSRRLNWDTDLSAMSLQPLHGLLQRARYVQYLGTGSNLLCSTIRSDAIKRYVKLLSIPCSARNAIRSRQLNWDIDLSLQPLRGLLQLARYAQYLGTGSNLLYSTIRSDAIKKYVTVAASFHTLFGPQCGGY
jgi:hypothetical protein